jgi:hypothetical protein
MKKNIENNLVNVKKLKDFCLANNPKKIIKNLTYDNKNNYWFQDNNSDILAVAHFDTVAYSKPNFEIIRNKNNKSVITGVQSIQLDDRLGLYIIAEILPKLNCNYDILITDNEEIGSTTARNFTTKKEYNWIFEFDRMETDPVLYQYSNEDTWYNAVKEISSIAKGSFSDISELDNLGCCAVNFGTGYYNAHTEKCFTDFESINNVINKFLNFYNKNKNKFFPYKPKFYNNYYFDRFSFTPVNKKIGKKEYKDNINNLLYYGNDYKKSDYMDYEEKEYKGNDDNYYKYMDYDKLLESDFDYLKYDIKKKKPFLIDDFEDINNQCLYDYENDVYIN